jgi:hypothetical protein
MPPNTNMSDGMQMAPHRFSLTGKLYDDAKNWVSLDNDITELPSSVRRSVAGRLRRRQRRNYRHNGLATRVEFAAQRATSCDHGPMSARRCGRG